MTQEKAVEIIGVFRLVYPYADIFKCETPEQLERKIDALISIWSASLPDVEDDIAGQTAQLCIRRFKFLPTVAEFREAAQEIRDRQDSEIREAFWSAKSALDCFPDKAEKMMEPRAWTVIQAMGGLNAFCPADRNSYDLEKFEKTYKALLRKLPAALPDKEIREIVGRN